MPGEDIYSWSTTAANNGTADTLINWAEGQARASVNNSSRSEMAAHAKQRNQINGSIVTTGTPNAQAFLSGNSYTTVPTGMVVKVKVGAGLTNTASMTLNMDGIGGVLVKTANGDNLLGSEFVANGYVDLIYNGTNWIFLYGREFFQEAMTGGGGVILGHQVFSTAGSFMYVPSPGMEACILECVGAGGGGGGAISAANEWMAGGGGGSGGYSRTYASAADIGGSQIITVGYGGTAGVGATPGNGSAGGDSSVGTLCIAKGGSGGLMSSSGQFGSGGAGGIAGTGHVTANGAPGGSGHYNIDNYNSGSTGGVGGSSALGGGASAPVFAAGTAAGNYGSGGSGASHNQNGMVVWGGAGSSGIVIIAEFAGRGAPGRDGPQGPIGPAGPSGPGTGDVLRSGVPTGGQMARWTDASHIDGVTINPPARTVYTTGSGIYTTPANAFWLEVEMVGGGGGGANGYGNGSNGAATTFGALLANGGGGNGVGGTASGGDINVKGADGSGSGMVAIAGTISGTGGQGASSPFGGAGRGLFNIAGGNASANTGSGGGGGAPNNTVTAQPGVGGGAGGYLRALIALPAASYAYSVGAGGGGAIITGADYYAGGAGGNGIIIVTAHFGG